MTWSKYGRLLTVLFVPLLIAGVLFFTLVVRPPTYATILCAPAFSIENCRTTDGLGEPWDERLRKEYVAWFDINTRPYEKNSFPYTIISGSQRLISGVRIVEVSPYPGTDDGPGSPIQRLRSLADEPISIKFGTNQADERPLDPLGCNELDFQDYPVSYTAGLCGIPTGVARVKFTVDPQGNSQLLQLKQAVESETSDARQNLILHYALGAPIFLLLFLLISGLFWLIRKATSYVAAG